MVSLMVITAALVLPVAVAHTRFWAIPLLTPRDALGARPAERERDDVDLTCMTHRVSVRVHKHTDAHVPDELVAKEGNTRERKKKTARQLKFARQSASQVDQLQEEKKKQREKEEREEDEFEDIDATHSDLSDSIDNAVNIEVSDVWAYNTDSPEEEVEEIDSSSPEIVDVDSLSDDDDPLPAPPLPPSPINQTHCPALMIAREHTQQWRYMIVLAGVYRVGLGWWLPFLLLGHAFPQALVLGM
jgi:hypothetical protein